LDALTFPLEIGFGKGSFGSEANQTFAFALRFELGR